MSELRVFIGSPSYNGQINCKTAKALWVCATRKHPKVHIANTHASLLAHAFNLLWCEMLNIDPPMDRWAMLHGDIVPENWWLDILLDEMEETGADVISAIAPIKNAHGHSSCAIGNPDTPWRPFRRLTMKELVDLPDTFSSADIGYPDFPLMVNTGCWVVDVTKPIWREVDDAGIAKVSFTINDRIRKSNDKFVAEVESEDWFFSRLCYEFGLDVRATKKVKLDHYGDAAYTNRGLWGDQHDDNLRNVAVKGASQRLSVRE